MFLTDDTWDRDRWPNFTFREISCSHSGLCDIDPHCMDRLQRMRNEIGPLTVTSGYRSPTHPIEAAKKVPGAHTTGYAFDIKCSGTRAYNVLREAILSGARGIGIRQNGEHNKRFIHLDWIHPENNLKVPRPTVWSYT